MQMQVRLCGEEAIAILWIGSNPSLEGSVIFHGTVKLFQFIPCSSEAVLSIYQLSAFLGPSPLLIQPVLQIY